MWFKKLKHECLEQLVANFNRFMEERTRAIEKIRDRRVNELKKERKKDFYWRGYNYEDADENYENSIYYLNNWIYDCNDNIYKDIENFKTVIDIAENYLFEEKDLGKRIIFNFVKGTVTTEPTGNPKTFGARFIVGTHRYTYNDKYFECVRCENVEPEFTDLFEY